MVQILHISYCTIGVVEKEEYKMKKWLMTSFCATTLLATSITSADAASLNRETKDEAKTENIQIIKEDSYQEFALKIMDKIILPNGQLDINNIEDLVNKKLNNLDVYKELANGKFVKENKANTTAKKETTNDAKPTENKEIKKQTPTKEATYPEVNNDTTAPEANKNNRTVPSNSNNQQAEAPVKTPTANVNQSVSEFEKQVVNLTNAERTKAGLKPLEIYTPLMNVAEAKSADMAKNNYFSHTSPTYGSPFDQIKAAGISYRAAGENIAQGQKTPQEVVQAWMDSPGHRQNIMNANYTHIGVGFVEDGNYWTQQFIQL